MTVFRHRGRWCAEITTGGITPTGKQKRTRRYAKTRAEALRIERELLTHRDRGMPIPNADLTVAQFLSAWLDDIEASDRADSTKVGYESITKNHLIPHLGRHKLKDLHQAHVNRMVDDIAMRRPSAAAYAKRVLSTALADAMRNDLVARNVAQLARPVKRSGRKELRIHPEDINTYITAIAEHPKADLFAFYLYTGVRRGEACALRWGNLDLDSDPPTARIEAAYTQTRQGFAITRTKTEKSRRTVSLTPELAELLRARKKHVLDTRYFDQNADIANDFVFATPSGDPPRPDTVTKDLNRLLADHGLKGIGPHQMRHLITSMLIARWGNIAAISQFLGHSNVRTTIDVYGHLITTGVQQVAIEVHHAIEEAQATTQQSN